MSIRVARALKSALEIVFRAARVVVDVEITNKGVEIISHDTAVKVREGR